MWADRGISWRIEEEAAIEDRGEEGDGVIEYSLLPPLGGGGSSVLEAREREREESRAAALRRSSDGIPSTDRVASSFFLSAPLSSSPLYSRPPLLPSRLPPPRRSIARVPILTSKDA